jgi:hypothetical protein
MYDSISPIPGAYEAGTITRSGGYKSFPAVHSKGGSTKGSSVVTLTGAPAYGLLLQYTVELTNVLNGQVSTQIGLFTYNRSSATASLADFISKFASHLTRYHDVEVIGTSATTLTIRSGYFGFTPSLTVQTPSITAANVLTAATAPSLLVPGDLVVLTPTPLGFTVVPFRTANVTVTSFYGVTLREQGVRANDGRDQVYNILSEGYVASQAGGAGTKTAASATLSVFTDGLRPGMFAFGGLSHGATVALTIGSHNQSASPLTPVNIARQLRPVTVDVLPGQIFEMQLKGI